jgi:NAD(P)-dependent dehydrogenase (short-subunit alcohol dehydrogenase family)
MNGRSVVVTGGTGALGAAVTSAFLDGGWHVVVPWIVERERDRLPEHERLVLVRADLFDPAAVAGVVEAAGPSLRAVVNLVGGFAEHGRIHETPVDVFEEQLRLNLRPGYLVCAAALPILL